MDSMNGTNSMNSTSMGNSTSMTNSTGGMSMTMMSILHFGNGDHILFGTWHPSNTGAVVGSCIGLIVFCILERCLAAYRRAQELRWGAKFLSASNSSIAGKGPDSEAPEYPLLSTRKQLFPPFILSHDVPRGIIQAFQSTFSYALMLVIMTYNSAYIISIIVGLGIGEIVFGRIARGSQDL